MSIIYFTKKYAETLATMRDRFRKEYPEYKDSKITYAGRLDPMAFGIMLILTNDDIYKKQDFIKLNKTYRVEFILGIESDTYDILGVIKYLNNFEDNFIKEKNIKFELNKLLLEEKQFFPAYSSRKVKGIPMWKLSRDGKYQEILRNIKIYNIKYLDFKTLTRRDFKKKYIEKILEVEGDFRQEEIFKIWQEYFKNTKRNIYKLYRVEFSVSAGTYIRSLVNLLGERLGSGGICLKIERVQLGEVKIDYLNKNSKNLK